MFNKAIQNS
jgi:enoyl-CoA hydratase/carnithine racemase